MNALLPTYHSRVPERATPRVLIAPQSFKGSADAVAVAAAIAKGVRSVWPDAEIIEMPLADGGEGTVRALVRATVLVGERRWNLRLKNGIDVRLPETDIAPALERLVALDKEKNLTTRDIVAIDLRLADRVTVRLSEAAAQARIDAAKDKAKKKGGSA